MPIEKSRKKQAPAAAKEVQARFFLIGYAEGGVA
jgi:hypothetical protein